ncbi:MAG: 4-alpha-glucanotransferase [bacterium]
MNVLSHEPYRRGGGILLHPTSLPGPFGIGDLGPSASRFIDFLEQAGMSYWQMLPLVPVMDEFSPYQSTSAMAGNPLLISPELLLEEGLIGQERLEGLPDFPEERVDVSMVLGWKQDLLKAAWRNFTHDPGSSLKQDFEEFCQHHSEWLEDFALFSALREVFEKKSWTEWPEEFKKREPSALAWAKDQHADSFGFHRFSQFLFFRQWQSLKNCVHEKGIRLIGDLPIFVAHDSADVWTHPEWFELDPDGNPIRVAGVPPDYFSPTGQRWGNPLFLWEAMESSGYSWWKLRMRILLETVDLVRIDHFRGFDQYWAIPAEDQTAENGSWVQGPGKSFFDAMLREFGTLPVIAEDLGLITPEVNSMRKECGFPGMKVLQFAFEDDWHQPFLPHNVESLSVIYTGTHDNNTTRGWWKEASPELRRNVCRYLGFESNEENIAANLTRLAWMSSSSLAITPLQDLLNLEGNCRMNLPGTISGNWIWRCTARQFDALNPNLLREWNEISGRA